MPIACSLKPWVLYPLQGAPSGSETGAAAACAGSQEKLEFDHIIPLSKGGSNTERNLQLLCEECNRSKGAKV